MYFYSSWLFHTYSLPAIVQAFILPQGGVRLMIHQSHGRNAANQRSNIWLISMVIFVSARATRMKIGS